MVWFGTSFQKFQHIHQTSVLRQDQRRAEDVAMLAPQKPWKNRWPQKEASNVLGNHLFCSSIFYFCMFIVFMSCFFLFLTMFFFFCVCLFGAKESCLEDTPSLKPRSDRQERQRRTWPCERQKNMAVPFFPIHAWNKHS